MGWLALWPRVASGVELGLYHTDIQAGTQIMKIFPNIRSINSSFELQIFLWMSLW